MNALLTITPPVLLASQSPRRRILLEQLNVEFTVEPSPADEVLDGSPAPAERARRLAARKATPVAEAHPNSLVLAADTIVGHEGTVLEKPDTPSQAVNMLHRLSDTTHSVFTGIALHHKASNRAVRESVETRVTFAALSQNEIEAYVSTESPMDKAGGYGIQDHTGPLFVKRLTGDYYNVVGLPLRRLYQTLVEHFDDLLE